MNMTTKLKRFALVALILAALLLAAGCTATDSEPVDAGSQNAGSQNTAPADPTRISDEQSLREALKAKDDRTIVLSDEIVITEELVVNGNKTLTGGSIVMDMRRVGSKESVLAVQKGATLVLDGTVVDGNSVSNCISVKAGGTLEAKSGSLIYGYPYGLDVSGKVNITDLHIDEALHTAINVAIFGEVQLNGGRISNNVYGIAVAEDAIANIAEGVVMENSYASFIVSYGTMDIRGGKYVGSADNAIENWGKMTIKGTKENPIEIYNGTKSGINSKNKATIDAEYINIYDMGWHGMCVEKNSTALLQNINFGKAGKTTVYINSAKATLRNVTVTDGQIYGIYATQNAEVELYDVTVKDIVQRGINNERSKLTADGLTIENTGTHGIYNAGDSSVLTINNANISNTGSGGVAVAKGKAFVTNTTVDGGKKESISIGKAGTITLESVVLKNSGNFAVGCYGGKATINGAKMQYTKNVSLKVTEGGKVTGSGISIASAGSQAISIEGGSTAKLTDVYVHTTQKAAVYVDRSTLTLSNANINYPATYGIAAKNNGKIILDEVQVHHAGDHGIGALNSYIVAGNILVTEPKRCGIYSEGENAQINMANVEVYNAGSCGFGFNGAKEITARNVLIENPATEGILAKAGAVVKKLDNVVINDPGNHGITAEGGATVTITVDTKYNPENTTGIGVAISNPGLNGIHCKDGTIVAKATTIDNPGGYGMNISAAGTVKANGVTITNAMSTTSAGVAGRGVSTDGKLILEKDGLTIEETKGHGIYMTAKATLEGTNLTIRNTGDNGIFSEGGAITLSKLTVENTKNQGVQVKGGMVSISDFDLSQTGGVAMRVRNAANVTLTKGKLNGKTYGVYADGTTETVLNDVTVEKAGTSTEALVHVAGTAKLELAGNTKVDGKDTGVVGVNLAASGVTFHLNGGTVTGADVVLVKGASIGLKSKLTQTLYVKPATYDGGTVIVTNAGISEADFVASTKLVDVHSESVYVGEDGKLVSAVAMLNNVIYGSLTEAVAEAEKTAAADTIYLLTSTTLTEQLRTTTDITIVADKAVTISTVSNSTGSVIYVTDGKLTLTGAAEDARITVSAAVKNTNLVYIEGGNVELTNVHLAGNPNSTAGNNSVYGIYTKTGSVTATSVTITDITKGDGINIRTGASATLDHVTIENCSRYGLKTFGTVNIYNTVDPSNALSIRNTYDHAMDIDNGGKVISTLNNVPNGTYAIRIDTTTKANNARGILVRGGGEVKLSHLSIKNTAFYGVEFLATNSTGTISNFEIAGTASHGVNVAGTATLTNGTITANTYGINVTSSGLTLSNVQVSGATADINLAKDKSITINGALPYTTDLKLAEYTLGAVVAVKGSDISDADFKAAMPLLVPENTDWIVKDTGLLAKAVCEHDWTEQVDKAPTCDEPGQKTMTCDLCGESRTEPIAPLGHTVEHVARVEPTPFADGNIEYWYCSVCDGVWSDEAKTNKITLADVVLPKLEGMVAEVNGQYFTSLAAAFEAADAASGEDTVTVLTDITGQSLITVNDDVKLVSGKSGGALTISGSGGIFTIASGKTLSVSGTAAGKITVGSTGTTAAVFYNEGTLNLTDVIISGGNYGVNTRANASTKLTNVTVTAPVKNGLQIAGNSQVTVTNVTITNCGSRGVEAGGRLVLLPATVGATALTIDTTANHGIYLSAAANVEGFGLTVKNTTANGIFSEGADITVSGLKLATTGQQGVQFKGGTVQINSFEIKDTTQAAVLVRNATALTLKDGTIDPKAIGIANQSGTNSTTLENVTVNGGSDTLISLVQGPSMIFNGVTLNNTNTAIADVTLASGATVKLQKALTSSVTVKPAAYTEGTQIAQKSGSISDADFAASTALLIPMDTQWIVDENGRLAKAVCEHVWGEPVVKEPSCNEGGSSTKTCTLCGEVRTETLPPYGEHAWGKPLIVAPTCGQSGSSVTICIRCGETSTKNLPATGEHSYAGVQTKAPTCEDSGVMTYTCAGCSASYTETVAALGHNAQYVAAVIPSLEKGGNLAHWTCTTCGACWEDAQQTVPTTKEAVTLPQVEAGNVAYMNGVAYETLDAAVAAANESGEASTIYLLADTSISAQIKPTVNVTVKAAKPVSITANIAQAFYVSAGRTLVMEGTGTDKITITSSLTSSNQEVFYNAGTLNLTNVAISGGHRAVNNRDNALMNLVSVSISNTADNGLHLAGGTTTVTDVTISNTKGHGIGCYGNLVLQPAYEGGFALTINTTGTSSAKKHGIYASYNPVITGSGLKIQNTTNAGFFGDRDASKTTTGVSLNLTNVVLENTGAQGIQAKKGTITISNFTVNGTGSAALRPYDNYGVTFVLSNGTVTTKTYGLAMDKASQAMTLNNVTFTRTGTKTEVVLSVTSSAQLTATNVTVNVPSGISPMTINGATTFEGITVVTPGAADENG